MNRDNPNAPPRLPFHQANAACRAFLPIGDSLFDIMERLKAAGHGAWVPYHDFFQSFATDAEELALHNRYLVELAKNALARPWPMRVDAKYQAELHSSPLLQRLRDHVHKENGMPERELENSYSMGEARWRREIDPVMRRCIRFYVEQKEEYDKRWRAVQDQSKHIFEREVVQHATALAQRFDLDESSRYSLFIEIMKRDAQGLGFEYDRNASASKYPVFSKKVSGEWNICWAIEDHRAFFWNVDQGRFMPSLEIRGRTLRGRIEKAGPGEFMYIRYAVIVPGFFNAYRIFRTPQQLETVIKAHLFMYSILADVVDTGFRQSLHGASA